MNTFNEFMVGVSAGEKKVVIRRLNAVLTPDEALNLAAWLVILAEPSASLRFDDLLTTIKNA